MEFGHSLGLAEGKSGKNTHGNQGVMVDYEEGAPAYGRRWVKLLERQEWT